MKKFYSTILAVAAVATMSAVNPAQKIETATLPADASAICPVVNFNAKAAAVENMTIATSQRNKISAKDDEATTSEWTYVGKGTAEDKCYSGETLEVDIYEDKNNPGVYAIDGFWAAVYEDANPLIVDCSTPGLVVVPIQNTGLSINAGTTEDPIVSAIYIFSYSYFVIDISEATAEDFLEYYDDVNITFADGTINVPGSALLKAYLDFSDDVVDSNDEPINQNIYYANDDPFVIAMPGVKITPEWIDYDSNALWNDGIVSGMYRTSNAQVNVTVQENTRIPGYYRICNAFPEISSDINFVFDASDPTCVRVPYQYLFEDSEDGSTFVISFSDLYKTKEEFLASKYSSYNITLGTGIGQKILTIPANAVGFIWPYSTSGSTSASSIYTSQGATVSFLYMSAVNTGVESITIDDANAPVEYYNLQGVRVANPENGLYIVRQGNKTSKVIR